jgi:hypothetical protein
VADHPLRPATDRRLGKPLPHQLPNRTQAAPKAHYCFVPQDICGISPSFPGLSPTSGHIPTRYSPVRRCRCRPRDLHVLSMPPAFTLSQDQTLRFIHHHQAQTQQQLRTALHSLSHRQFPNHPKITRHQTKAHPRRQHPSQSTNTRAPTAHPTPRTSNPSTSHQHITADTTAIPQPSTQPSLRTAKNQTLPKPIHLSKNNTRSARDNLR